MMGIAQATNPTAYRGFVQVTNNIENTEVDKTLYKGILEYSYSKDSKSSKDQMFILKHAVKQSN